MLVEIWVTGENQYNFYSYHAPQTGFFVFKNGEFEGIYDSLAECREYTIDFDNRFGDGTFSLPEQD